MQILHLSMSTDKRQTFANFSLFIVRNTNLAVNNLSLTAKFLSVYSKKHKSRS